MSPFHKVFIVDLTRPYKPIAEADATIHVSEKRTWALVPDYTKDRVKRCLLGSSAFYTRPAAERVKLTALYKLASLSHMFRYKAPGLIANVLAELKLYKETRVVH